jgi:hypothetical protein
MGNIESTFDIHFKGVVQRIILFDNVLAKAERS